MPRPRAVLALLLAASPLFAQAPKAPPPSREPELRKSIGAAWEGLATWCVHWKLKPEALAAADAALDADPANAKAKAAREAADKAADGGNETLRKEHAKKLADVKKQAAGLWREVAASPHADKDAEAYDATWGRALELDPKSIQPAHEAEVKAAMAKQDWKRAARLLAQEEKSLPADPERAKRLHELDARASVTEPLLLKASTHDMRYFLSLPPSWSAGKTWPVLVACEGAGCGYHDQCARFAGFRKDVPVIILTPCAFSNSGGPKKDKHPWYTAELMDQWTNRNTMEFDDPGIMAALADVKRDWGGEDKFFISGFSGGGIICWWEIFRRPAQLRGAFPACANYAGYPTPQGEGGRDLPIRAFQGEKDGYIEMLTASWEEAVKDLKAAGFTDFNRTLLPDVPHQACHAPIFKEIDAILRK